jgi:broad specificity phosphatase PhoE
VPGPLLLIRHAQSVWNEAGLWQGWADPPLSPLGEEQTLQAAARLAAEPPFDLLVASDLSRARRTGQLLAAALNLDVCSVLDPGLREYDVGVWSGHTREEIEAGWPGEIARFSANDMVAPPGGEDRAAFDARVVAAGRRVGEAAEQSGASRVLVVAHGGVVRALARAADQPEHRIGHLAGYWGRHTAAGLFPEQPVNLLDGQIAADAGEGTAIAGV